jgi:hypothetical protein
MLDAASEGGGLYAYRHTHEAGTWALASAFPRRPDPLAFDVVVCEYLTFMEVMQQARLAALCLTDTTTRERWSALDGGCDDA